MDLFEKAYQERLEREAPLAARMRPQTIDEFVGQDHIVGTGRLLRRAIQADQLGSLIFCGPPGTGKTTLARVIANSTKAHFTALNAVLAGVKDIRAAIEEAKELARMYARRTILFIDEVHRFNKAQQDALLPWVENGTVIFVGATTENPYFEVNRALVSRSRIFQLTPLTTDHLNQILHAALHDKKRGYGKLDIRIDDKAEEHLVSVSNGDARALLNALELAVETTQPSPNQSIHITLEVAEESIQKRAVLYDKEGDYHFDTISAFIKSIRGSDPDAALYWMAKMVYAGEHPRYIFRRMLILASEDIGMADPHALQVVVSAAQAFEYVGMPEGRFHLAQAALYLATTQKSNSAFAFFDALSSVEKESDSGVPNHLRDPSRDSKGFGHGKGYLYPHDYRDHWVAQQYLPSSLQGRVFYQPTDQGYEATIRTEVSRRREAQLSAMLTEENTTSTLESLTFSTRSRDAEQWLGRTISKAGTQLGEIRDHLFDQANVARHSCVLDLKVGSGLLTWEALRRAPEGSVFSLVKDSKNAELIQSQASMLTETERPITIQASLENIENSLGEYSHMKFDVIVGYNALAGSQTKASDIRKIRSIIAEDGAVSLADNIAVNTQRLYDLINPQSLPNELFKKVKRAEESIYKNPDDHLVNWTIENMLKNWNNAGFKTEYETRDIKRSFTVSKGVIQRWFSQSQGDKKSYAERLSAFLSLDEIEEVKGAFIRQLLNSTCDWKSQILFVLARPTT